MNTPPLAGGSDQDPELDAGLRVAFGRPSRAAPSVLDAIERLTGEAPRILLRDADSESGASPMIDPSSSERRSIPQGRGSYQILGEIARGGMGVVMKGHDNDLGRDVALKVLHKELAKRPEVLQRFVEEAQIGGQLQHPGIVPVYELGLMADERPYFTMKLVKGRTLAALLAERTSATVDRRRLLDVFESVCQTMAYAHSRGVIHRDLKPANVMVGAFGEVQVVDWGLAKVLRQGGTADEKRAKQTNISIIETVRSEPGSHGSHSLVGSVMGTPAYMSPEQARGEIEKLDERSDVFSLGAILCEILTGAPPYLGESDKTLVEAANAKLDDATKRLEGCAADPELVTLCRECLAPAQSARPRSAELLAQRIHAYSTSVEERARQAQVDAAEARIKAQEERRARKLTVGLAASVLVTILVVGGGWAWISSERTRRERETEAQVAGALHEATLERGKGRWAEALAAVERAEGLVGSGSASPALRARVAGDLDAIHIEANAARARDELARDNASLLAELSDIRQPEGDTVYPTDWAKVDDDYRAIFARRGLDPHGDDVAQASAALSSRGVSVELAAALDAWADVRASAGDKPGAAQLLALSRRIDSDTTRGRLRDAMLSQDGAELRAFVADEDLARLPATTLHLLSKSVRKRIGASEALVVLRRAQQDYPGDFMLSMSLARALSNATPPHAEESTRFYTAALALRPSSTEAAHELGKLLQEPLKDHVRAAELFRAAVRSHPEDGHLRAHLALSLPQVGDVDGGRAAAREAIALAPRDGWAHYVLANILYVDHELDGAIKSFRTSVDLDPNNADAHRMLGAAFIDEHEFEEAIRACGRALEIDPRSADTYRTLGYALRGVGDYGGELEADRQAIALDPGLAAAHADLGAALTRDDHLDLSLASSRRALELDPRMTTAQFNVGLALRRMGDVDGAIDAFRKAIELDPKLAAMRFSLGSALAAKGDLDCAIEADREAIGVDPTFAPAYGGLGSALKSRGDLAAAIAAFHKTIELDPQNVAAYSNMGDAMQHTGDFDGAVAAERAAIAIDPKCTAAYMNLGAILNDNLRDHAGAIQAFRKAIELEPKYATAHLNLAIALEASGDLDGAMEANLEAADLDPMNATRTNALVWQLATDADPARRNGAEAVRLGKRAIGLTPGDPNAFDNLGAALCCAREWHQAIDALETSIRLNRADDEFARLMNADNHCFLAIAHAHLDELAEARAQLALAHTWYGAHRQHTNAAETARFLEEARAAIAAAARH